MGRKNQNKPKPVEVTVPKNHKELSKQKRNDLNRLLDKLIKVSVLAVGAGKNRDCFLEMMKLLERINTIEADLQTSFPSRNDETMKALKDWMLENEGRIEGVEISKFDGYGYGLKAAKDMKKSDLLISVPRKLMMTTEAAQKTELSCLIKKDPMLKHMPNMTLALFVLLEKVRGDSFWTPYINSLPASYNTVMYFTVEEIDSLKGSPMYEPSMKQCLNIARQYGYLLNLFNNSTDAASTIFRNTFTYEQYRWAVSTVMTRQNFIPASNPERTMILALIPYWDMGNHENAELTTDYNVELDQSEYYSFRDYKEGEQVCMSYGKRPNSELFLHNGFVHEKNAADGVKLRLGVSKSDPLFHLKTQLMDKHQIPSCLDFLLPANPRPFLPHPKFIGFLRIFNMDEDTLTKYLNSHDSSDAEAILTPEQFHPVDIKVWQFLTTRIKLLLAAYPTSIEEDEKLLTDLTLPCSKQLPILQRLTEKRILTNTLEDLIMIQEKHAENQKDEETETKES